MTSNTVLDRRASIIMCLNTPCCVHVSQRFFVSYCVVLYRVAFVFRHVVMCCLLCFIVMCCVLLWFFMCPVFCVLLCCVCFYVFGVF